MDRQAAKFWGEKEQQMNFPQEIRLEHLTKKQRNNFFNHFTLRHFDRNDVLLAAGTVPTHLLMLVKGQVTVYFKDTPATSLSAKALKLTVTPGSCIKSQIVYGAMGTAILGKEYEFENVELIGLEHDMLDVNCPYSYIANGSVFAYQIPFQQFFKSMQDLNPQGLIDLRLKVA